MSFSLKSYNSDLILEFLANPHADKLLLLNHSPVVPEPTLILKLLLITMAFVTKRTKGKSNKLIIPWGKTIHLLPWELFD